MKGGTPQRSNTAASRCAPNVAAAASVFGSHFRSGRFPMPGVAAAMEDCFKLAMNDPEGKRMQALLAEAARDTVPPPLVNKDDDDTGDELGPRYYGGTSLPPLGVPAELPATQLFPPLGRRAPQHLVPPPPGGWQSMHQQQRKAPVAAPDEIGQGYWKCPKPGCGNINAPERKRCKCKAWRGGKREPKRQKVKAATKDQQTPASNAADVPLGEVNVTPTGRVPGNMSPVTGVGSVDTTATLGTADTDTTIPAKNYLQLQ